MMKVFPHAGPGAAPGDRDGKAGRMLLSAQGCQRVSAFKVWGESPGCGIPGPQTFTNYIANNF